MGSTSGENGFSAGFTFEEEDDPIILPKLNPSTSATGPSTTTSTSVKKVIPTVDLTDSPPLQHAQLSLPTSTSSPPKKSSSSKHSISSNSTSTPAPTANAPSKGLALPSSGKKFIPTATTSTAQATKPFATQQPPLSLPRGSTTSSFSIPSPNPNQTTKSPPIDPSPVAGGFSSFSSFAIPSNPPSSSNSTPRARPPPAQTVGSSFTNLLNHSQHSHQQQQSLGAIPVISSGSVARTPSAFLPFASSSTSSFHQHQPQASSSRSQQSSHPLQQRDQPSNKNYYKEQSAQVNAAARQQRRQPSASTSHFSSNGRGGGGGGEMIDLTNAGDDSSDDDDLLIDDTPICIGHISSLALVLHLVNDIQGPPPPILYDSSGNQIQNLPPGYWRAPPQPPLAVVLYRGAKNNGSENMRISSLRSREEFGFMEHKLSNVIAPLLGDGFSGMGVSDKNCKLWCEACVLRKGERSPMMLPLQLLLFAKPIDIPFVSTTLSNNAIYLDHPVSYNPALHHGYRYQNPHNPPMGGLGSREAERRRTHLMDGLYGGYARQTVTKKEDVQRQQVQDVFENLKSGLDVEEQEPDAIISTKLYPHQKQALSFLLDRETIINTDLPTSSSSSSSTPPEVIISLWTRIYSPSGRPRGWKSLVTSLEIPGSPPPSQARGSILADDMGLGKTVVVISLVAHTRLEAKEWAKLPPEKDVIDPRLDGMLGEGKVAGKVGVEEFKSGLFGGEDLLVAATGGGGSGNSKKAEAKAKREKKREDAVSSRFKRLVTRSAGTLIVCPLSTVQNWESQFDEHVMKIGGVGYSVNGNGKGKGREGDHDEEEEGAEAGGKKCALSVYVYHGNNREQDPYKLAQYDVVITTFSTLGAEFSRQGRAEEERARESDDEVEIISSSVVAEEEKGKQKKRKRKKIEGSGESPLQMIQWFRVVLDEAHIIKEHTTIQARAACDLSASRRTALSGTPLQNSLNDLFSLVRFLRLEPFTDRAIWTQHIGALAKSNDPLGVSRLKLIMRHLALRRTKASVDKEGKPILSLPPNDQRIVYLDFDPAESAFYNQHHQRYKHDFKQLQATDSVMKNYCSILQELLRLRQICVHMALVRDSEDSNNGSTDLVKMIEEHGISKPRAIQLLGLMRDAGEAKCSECGFDMLPGGAAGTGDVDELIEVDKKPVVKKRKTKASAPASAACSEDERNVIPSAAGTEPISIVTRCQHLYCRECFKKVCPELFLPPPPPPPPLPIDSEELPPPPPPPLKAICTVCSTEFFPRLDAVELGAKEVLKALEDTAEDVSQAASSGKKVKGTRFFEHSTKTKALMRDIFPFSQANRASANYWEEMDLTQAKTETIGFQPVKGEVVKSVVFSQWTKLLDRIGDELDGANIKYGRLDGGMNRDQRTKAMDTFKIDPACEVLLVSLRAGGVGLNLTAGRRVYLMEPFWNPAVENQAIDRIHRLGQTMPVQTVRYVVSKSIEENMLKIQKRKTELANMSIGQTLSKSELAKRREEDLKTLLG